MLECRNDFATPLSLFALDSSFLSPTSDGGAAAIVCSEEFVRRNRLENNAVEVLAMDMATDTHGTFEEKSMIKVVCLQRRIQYPMFDEVLNPLLVSVLEFDIIIKIFW